MSWGLGDMIREIDDKINALSDERSALIAELKLYTEPNDRTTAIAFRLAKIQRQDMELSNERQRLTH